MWFLLNILYTKDAGPQKVYQNWFFPAAFELSLEDRDWEWKCSIPNLFLRIHSQAPWEWWGHNTKAKLAVHHLRCSWECGHQLRGKEFAWLCWDWWRCILHWRDLYRPGFWSRTVRWAEVSWCYCFPQKIVPCWRWSWWETFSRGGMQNAQLHNQLAVPLLSPLSSFS